MLDIPRFVPKSGYADAFGLQWNRFRKTQLDSYTGTTISLDRLRRCVGGDLSVLRGKSVLEVGCGAGRFTEILRAHGAQVLSLDLSSAVEANLVNYREQAGAAASNNYICQASMLDAPVAPRSVDAVIALGVVQHTPNSESTVQALADYVKPGGELVIDHYGLDYNVEWPRRLMRRFLLALPARWGSPIALTASRALVQVHRLFWRRGRIARIARARLQKISPLVDYYDSYPQLPRAILVEWCVLDTHDTVTDFYKHLRSLDQVCAMVSNAGLEIVRAAHGGNGVEVRARRPPDSE
ncbi:class I SAM-dependent methyltransferase [Bradyrhizobium sp. SYSU BS000235]|uniref:class I SAM-dependent methyltransferase n=1 Tax=Bradyrhizobium sp. SYSU BS000235 TaxID=3411332 RepID=UPI003C74D933